MSQTPKRYDTVTGAEIDPWKRIADLEARCAELVLELGAWKREAERQYGNYRHLRYGDIDYPTEGALDAYVAKAIDTAKEGK